MGTQKRKLYVPSGGGRARLVREGFSGSSLDVPISTPGSVGTDTRLIQRPGRAQTSGFLESSSQMILLPPALLQSDGEPLKV